jgi:hypothetical protein
MRGDTATKTLPGVLIGGRIDLRPAAFTPGLKTI